MLKINIKRAITIFLSAIIFFCVSLKLTGTFNDSRTPDFVITYLSQPSEPGTDEERGIPQKMPIPNEEGEEKAPEEETKEKTGCEDTFPAEPGNFQKFTNAEIIQISQNENKFSDPYHKIFSPPPQGIYLLS